MTPSVDFNKDQIILICAILGTTISPYLFFWQASQETEELRASRTAKPLRTHPDQASRQIKRITLDTLIGMGISNVIAFFIMLTAAATLHSQGITNLTSSAQAAEALKPVAGTCIQQFKVFKIFESFKFH